jgi:ATP-dependent Clp protease adapter protein ClpS
LRACAVDIDDLRAALLAIVRDNTPIAPAGSPVHPQASLEFQRSLQRAIMLVQATRGRDVPPTGLRHLARQAARRALAFFGIHVGWGTVNGADVLVAIFGEKDSLAVSELQRRGVTRFDVTRWLAHGIATSDPPDAVDPSIAAGAELDVVLLDDDFTPMEFVVKVLQDELALDKIAATQRMLAIHHEGRAACGRFAADVAAGKVERVHAAARQQGHPLRCILEPASPG